MNFKSIIKTAFVSTLIFGVTSVFAEFKPVRIAHYTGVLCSAPVHVAWLKGYLDEEFKTRLNTFLLIILFLLGLFIIKFHQWDKHIPRTSVVASSTTGVQIGCKVTNFL